MLLEQVELNWRHIWDTFGANWKRIWNSMGQIEGRFGGHWGQIMGALGTHRGCIRSVLEGELGENLVRLRVECVLFLRVNWKVYFLYLCVSDES